MANIYHWHHASTPPPDDRTVIISTADQVGDPSTPQIWFGYYSREHNEWLSVEGSVVNVLQWTELPRAPRDGGSGQSGRDLPSREAEARP